MLFRRLVRLPEYELARGKPGTFAMTREHADVEAATPAARSASGGLGDERANIACPVADAVFYFGGGRLSGIRGQSTKLRPVLTYRSGRPDAYLVFAKRICDRPDLRRARDMTRRCYRLLMSDGVSRRLTWCQSF